MPGFLLDLDGTLYNGNYPIPQAVEFIEWLNTCGYPYLLLTNNSSRTPEAVAHHLNEMGITVGSDAIFSSALATCLYMREHTSYRTVYCIGEDGLRHALTEAGFLLSEEKPDAVVQGIDRSLTYDKLCNAVRYILNGAAYLLTNPDHLIPWNGQLSPGAGSISAAIQTAVQQKPILIGKPSPIIMNYAIAKLGLPAGEVWAVGDNLRTDILGGSVAGCRTALVLTGIARQETVQQQMAEAGVQPDALCDDLLHLRKLVEREHAS
ncbi:MAG: HAD-superfamily subfamily hydrolase like protein [Paenibacillus sp.]|jgi:4-nitrophenyl phosphatase|nr:HAD-superfamily subfamily hydrolase like protein [Paenibacillus sp.]